MMAVATPQTLEGRPPPNDIDAEAAVLSAVLIDDRLLDDVTDLRPEHFYAEAHRRIFEACRWLRERGRPVDVVQVCSRLADERRLAQVGGKGYVVELLNAAPALTHLEAYAGRVVERWRLREVIRACHQTLGEAYEGQTTAQGLIERHEGALEKIGRTAEASDVEKIGPIVKRAAAAMAETAKRTHGSGLVGVTTGIRAVDKFTGGRKPGALTILAARPGMGKTSLALFEAASVSEGERVVDDVAVLDASLVFSLEMLKEECAGRFISMDAGIDARKAQSGALNPYEWTSVTESCIRVARRRIFIDDSSAITLGEMRAKIRRTQAECARLGWSLAHVVVDYLQLATGHGQNREQEIASLSRGCKNIAKDFGVAVLALSQLNRDAEKRAGKEKRPQLSDLRESGSLEQDADNVCFIYRPDYYDPKAEKGITELIYAKQRGGPTGTVRAKFNAETTCFGNLPDDFEPRDHYGDRE